MSNLIKLVAPNGITTVFVTPEKAERLKTIQGYQEYREPVVGPLAAVSEPAKPTRKPRAKKV
jgi:hypothetical protein